MNPVPEIAENLEAELAAWAIPLDEPEAVSPPASPAEEPSSSNLLPNTAVLPFRLDELPSEGFTPRLSRFDEVA